MEPDQIRGTFCRVQPQVECLVFYQPSASAIANRHVELIKAAVIKLWLGISFDRVEVLMVRFFSLLIVMPVRSNPFIVSFGNMGHGDFLHHEMAVLLDILGHEVDLASTAAEVAGRHLPALTAEQLCGELLAGIT